MGEHLLCSMLEILDLISAPLKVNKCINKMTITTRSQKNRKCL
jgi:hypothetical protein